MLQHVFMLQKHILVKPIHPQDLADTSAPVIVVDIYFFLLHSGFHPVTMVGKHRFILPNTSLSKDITAAVAGNIRGTANHCRKNLPQ